MACPCFGHKWDTLWAFDCASLSGWIFVEDILKSFQAGPSFSILSKPVLVYARGRLLCVLGSPTMPAALASTPLLTVPWVARME